MKEYLQNIEEVLKDNQTSRRIALGWISDFYGEHRVKPTGACGSFSLPRELNMEQGLSLIHI